MRGPACAMYEVITKYGRQLAVGGVHERTCECRVVGGWIMDPPLPLVDLAVWLNGG